MTFEEELNDVLPADLPERDIVVAKAAEHLALIEEANRQFNLTRITGPREAAIKHVLDCVIPWRLFSGARHVLDAGTGAGFPGIPLALVLPGVRFTLAESIQKKARFVETVVEQIVVPNASIAPDRAEDLVRDRAIDVIVARALAPIPRALALFARVLRPGTRLILYKGPDVEQEISEAAAEARKRKLQINVVMRYSLPDDQGERTVVEIK